MGKRMLNDIVVVCFAKANRQIMDSIDWQLAKAGEILAAQRIVRQSWTPQHTIHLKKRLQVGISTVFLSVPSTTGLNTLPEALGMVLSGEIGGEYFDVKNIYKTCTIEAMKEIPKYHRSFANRHYTLVDASFLGYLKGRQLVITEDVLTTGGSARQFVCSLRRHGVEVQAVVSLMGNTNWNAPPQLTDKLQRTLRNTGLVIKGRDLAEVLSVGEIEGLVEFINMTEGAQNLTKLDQKLQSILSNRFTNLG